jgi:hypothetical protein
MLTAAITNPVYLAVNNLSSNTTLINSIGVTVMSSPAGSPYVLVSGSGLAPGASASVTLQFSNPASGGITDNLSVITTTP